MVKPVEENRKFIRRLGWHLQKGGIDYNLYDKDKKFLCSIKIIHAKGKKREVAPSSVCKTMKFCEERNKKWPPPKK